MSGALKALKGADELAAVGSKVDDLARVGGNADEVARLGTKLDDLATKVDDFGKTAANAKGAKGMDGWTKAALIGGGGALLFVPGLGSKVTRTAGENAGGTVGGALGGLLGGFSKELLFLLVPCLILSCCSSSGFLIFAQMRG